VLCLISTFIYSALRNTNTTLLPSQGDVTCPAKRPARRFACLWPGLYTLPVVP